MQKITPFLWFVDQAEEALHFYEGVFPGSKITSLVKMPPEVPPKGKAMVGSIELLGEHFTFLNGGPVPGFTFSPATSFVINCETQEEIDHYWEKLGEGGKYNVCGWLTDKFGVTWQIVPTVLPQYLSSSDPGVRQRVTQAFMQMQKFDIAKLEEAAKG